MCMGGGGGDGGAAERKRQEEERQGRIRAGNKAINDTFGQFDDDFYQGRREAYTSYAQPQINRQYEDAFEELRKTLAASNLSQSSVAARRRGRLEEQLGEMTRKMNLTAQDYSNRAREQIESARTGLQSQNMNMADPALASANALTRAQQLNEVPVFDPITNLFASAAEGLATQADLERRSKSRYDTGLFSPRSSARNVG
tara:strand:- start:26 stop:625 length:600 start_codon:yes stop_codon:yes gene_type:complete